MGILWVILIGFIAGLLARAVKPGDDSMGFIMTTLLGIGGALVASFLGQALNLYAPGEPVGLLAAVFGAVIILFVISAIKKKR